MDRVAAGWGERVVPIRLTADEMRLCREMGVSRQRYAEQRGLKAYGFASAEMHTRGYTGELAFSKYLRIPMPTDWTWEGDQRRGFDTGGWQVRTAYRRDGKMLIRPRDKDGHYALLLTCDRPVIWLVGWCTLAEAKECGEPGVTPGGNPQPCLYVAQDKLNAFPNIRGSFCLREEGEHGIAA